MTLKQDPTKTEMDSMTYNRNDTFKYTIESAGTSKELEYKPEWKKWKGFYLNSPELHSVVNRKAMWTVGKGYKTKKKDKKVLDSIRGNGLDTFNSIMFNAVVTYTTCGDFFAEIIRDKRNKIINLKPLNPGTIKIHANNQGVITHYSQKIGYDDDEIIFNPTEIFHLAWNRISDQIHGNSTVEKLTEIISMIQEAKQDMRIVFHRYVKPLWVFSVDTDDSTEISDFKKKIDRTVQKAENLIVPKDTVDNIERVSIPQFSTLDPLPWIRFLELEFVKSEGVPNIILGEGNQVTEATAKVLYLAFQQMVEWNQLFLQEQIKAQLGIDIEFEFPAQIQEELQEDEKKDGGIDDHVKVDNS